LVVGEFCRAMFSQPENCNVHPVSDAAVTSERVNIRNDIAHETEYAENHGCGKGDSSRRSSVLALIHRLVSCRPNGVLADTVSPREDLLRIVTQTIQICTGIPNIPRISHFSFPSLSHSPSSFFCAPLQSLHLYDEKQPTSRSQLRSNIRHRLSAS
jgi:hypothetical protein